MAFLIKTNVAQGTDVLVRDLGFPIPHSGGAVALTTDEEVYSAQHSNDLLELLLNGVYGTTSTLILNDGVADIPITDVPAFLVSALLHRADAPYGVVKTNASNEITTSLTFAGGASLSNMIAATDVNLNFNKVTNLTAGTSANDAVNKAQLDAVSASSKMWKELLLSSAQLDSVNGAISQAIPFWLTGQPAVNDTLQVTDGTTTDTYTFKVSAVAPFDVGIGGSVGATLSNLADRINTASTLWSAISTTSLGSLNGTVVVIHRKNQSSASFADRLYGTFVTPSLAKYVSYAGETDYASSVSVTIPSTDPTTKAFGIGRQGANLAPNETHICRDVDNVYTWNPDDAQWEITASNAFTFVNGLLEVSGTVEPDFGTLGGVTSLGMTASAGALNKVARIDHVHTHGDRGVDAAGSQHDADQIDVEGTYPHIAGSPSSLETAISAINSNFGAGKYVGKVIGLGNTKKILEGGVQYLQMAGVQTSAAGLRMLRSGSFTAASVQVNVADMSRAYKVSIKVNGVEATNLALPVTLLGASSTSLSGSFNAGDLVSVSIERTSGAGSSTFSEMHALLEYIDA